MNMAILPSLFPNFVNPSLAQQSIALGAFFGGVELWTRSQMDAADNWPFYHTLNQWADFPSAAIVAYLAYSTLDAYWRPAVAGYTLFIPLIGKVIENHALRQLAEKRAQAKKPELVKASITITASHLFSRMFITASKVLLLMLAAQQTWKDLTTVGIPLTQFLFNALSTACLAESTLQHFQQKLPSP